MALAQFSGANVTEVKLENENGTLVYGIGLKTSDGEYLDVKVDANTSKIVTIDADEPDGQNNDLDDGEVDND